jgi:hypothetical protein
MRILTKSDFLECRACRHSFWLARHKPDVLPRSTPNDFDLMLMQDGYDVEAVVRAHIQSWPDAATYKLQATYKTDDGLLVRADLIRQIDDKTIELFEVKSATSIRGHLEDAAFQVIAIERSGIVVAKINIIHVDKTYVRDGDIDAANLLAVEDVTDAVREICPTLEPEINAAQAWINRATIDENGCDCVYQGSVPNHCAGFDHFNPNIPKQSIYLLPNIRTKRVSGFVDEGRFDLADIEADEVTPAMLAVLQAAKAGAPIISKDNIRQFLNQMEFPLYFYDYETIKSAVPIMDGVSPHQQIPVQVSIHSLAADGKLRHSEFLADGPGQRLELVESLRQGIGDTGHCVSWNKSFEIGCNKGLAIAFPVYAQFLNSMNERTVDLMEVFKRDYVDIRFKGSTSIKNVLPIVCPHLSYDGLAVGNGGTAMAAWLSMSREADPDVKAKKREELLEYCQLDTFAMVEIYKFLLEVTRA